MTWRRCAPTLRDFVRNYRLYLQIARQVLKDLCTIRQSLGGCYSQHLTPRLETSWDCLPVSRQVDFRTHFYPSPLPEAQCIASAHALGLPPLPPHAVLLERKRQIGARIGATI